MINNTYYKKQDLNRLMLGKLNKALSKNYKFDTGVNTLKYYIKNSCYKFEDLNKFYVGFKDLTFIEVPKLVYDTINFYKDFRSENKKEVLELSYIGPDWSEIQLHFDTEIDMLEYVKNIDSEIETIKDLKNDSEYTIKNIEL